MTMLLLFAGIAAFAMSALLRRDRAVRRLVRMLHEDPDASALTAAWQVALAAKARDAMTVKAEQARMVRIMAASDEEAWNTLTAPERQP